MFFLSIASIDYLEYDIYFLLTISIGTYRAQFKADIQHDVCETADRIVEMLGDCATLISQSCVDAVSDLFFTKVRTNFTCLECLHDNCTIEQFGQHSYIAIPIDNSKNNRRNAVAGYSLFTGLVRTLADPDDLMCKECPKKDKEDFVFSREIVHLPRLLMVNLVRPGASVKDTRAVFSESIIDFGKLVTTDGTFLGQSTTYGMVQHFVTILVISLRYPVLTRPVACCVCWVELRAIVFHKGNNTSGHYYVFVKKRVELEKTLGTWKRTKTMVFDW